MSIYTMPIYPMHNEQMSIYYFTNFFNHGYEEYNVDYIDTNLYFITNFFDFNKELEKYEENNESVVPYLIEEHIFEKVHGIYYLF